MQVHRAILQARKHAFIFLFFLSWYRNKIFNLLYDGSHLYK